VGNKNQCEANNETIYDHFVQRHLSEKAPDENDPTKTPPMNAVDANWIRKLQPQTNVY